MQSAWEEEPAKVRKEEESWHDHVKEKEQEKTAFCVYPTNEESSM